MRGEGKFYLTDEAGRWIFGPGPAELLEQVERTGSLRAAAGKMGLSYSKALKILHTAERGLAMPLVSTEAGGPGGRRQHHHPPGQGSAGLVPAGPAGGGGDCPGSAGPPAPGRPIGYKKTAPRWGLISHGAAVAGGGGNGPGGGR